MDIVAEVLLKAAKDAEKFKSTEVEKHLELELDLGTLLATDINQIDVKDFRLAKDVYLLNLARDNTQLLFNKIWDLPTERVDEAILAKLPRSTFVLPRENPLPKPKALTKWQKFAKEKSIQKTKKSKLNYDEVLQKWVPLHGYKRAAAEKQKDWAMEVPVNSDPNEDQFSKKADAKKERVAKNEYQRLRNLAASKSVKIPKVGLPLTDHLGPKQLHTALTVARTSTASLGRFQDRLPKEKDAKKIGDMIPNNRKRKQPVPIPAQERQENIKILDSVLNKKPKFDLEKAVNRELYHKEQERSEEKKNVKPRGGGKKRTTSMKGKGAGKRAPAPKPGAGTKPSGGHGKHVRKNTGRKRR